MRFVWLLLLLVGTVPCVGSSGADSLIEADLSIESQSDLCRDISPDATHLILVDRLLRRPRVRDWVRLPIGRIFGVQHDGTGKAVVKLTIQVGRNRDSLLLKHIRLKNVSSRFRHVGWTVKTSPGAVLNAPR